MMKKGQRINRIAAIMLMALLLVAALPSYAFAARGLDCSIPVTKLVQGDAPTTNEAFSFIISAVTTGAPMPASDTLTISGNGTEIFNIHYVHAGVYEYEITETAGSANGYSYDSTIYRITAVVTNTDAGGLNAELLIQKPGGTEKYTQILFANTYTGPVAPPPPGTDPAGSLTISNTVTGSMGNIADVFHFTVQFFDKDGNELTEAFPFSGVNAAGGAIRSGDTIILKHEQSICVKDLPVGTVYTVTEVESDQNGYLTTARNSAGTITASGNASHWENYRPGLNDPSPATVILDPQKTLDGIAPQGSQFTFYLKDENGHVIEAVHNSGGAIAFSPITLTQAGTYIYYMSESAAVPSGITYDGSVYKVTIIVTRAADALVSRTGILRNGEPFNGGVPVFENKTVPGGDHDTDRIITIYKNWTGDDDARDARPDSIAVHVSQYGQADMRVVLTEDNGWQASVKASASGSVTVAEDVPEGYISSVSGNPNAGFVITNTYTGETPPNPDPDPEPTPNPTPNGGTDVPKTGDEADMPGMIAGFAICILVIAAVLIGMRWIKKRYRE